MKNSARNLVFGILKYVITLLFPFLVRSLLITKFGMEYIGLGSLFTSILGILNLSELGFSSAIIYALYKPIANNDTDKINGYMGLFKRIYMVIGISMLTIGMIFCPIIQFLIHGAIPSDINIYLLFIIQLLNSSFSYLFSGYKSALLIANQRADIYTKIQIIAQMMVYCLEITSIIVFENYYIYASSILIGNILTNILLSQYTKVSFPYFHGHKNLLPDEKKELYGNVKSLFGHQLDAVVINSADSIVISSFLGLKLLGIYNNYYMIFNAILNLLIVIANSFVATIGNSVVRNGQDKNYEDFGLFSYVLGLIDIICAVLMVCLYQPFIRLWTGGENTLPFITMCLLVISFYVRQIRRPVITYKAACGLWKQDRYKPYIAACINLIANLILVQFIGLNGVIISTIISMVLIEFPWETTVLFHSYFKQSKKNFYIDQAVKILELIIIGCVVYFVGIKIPDGTYVFFFVKAVSLALLTIMLIVFVNIRDKRFRNVAAYAIRLLQLNHKTNLGG